ncbi:hypothetical protein M0812_20730 [Anaeramoeba flamelloides]|uniref:Uncharacterized protein n=1 Tax=Anaeramoeba flamelloides TaxID=1746091 RepID=A0AAV7YVA1_9EUKA|nr:hypothetical protein M0812_20730 [Anaeramoeba flamelloides]
MSSSEEDEVIKVKKSVGTAIPTCRTPLHVVGVQPETPIAWSKNGMYLTFVSGNYSIYIIKKIENKRGQQTVLNFQITATLEGHTKPVNALIFHPTRPILISGGFEGIFIWNLENSTLKQRISPNNYQNAHQGTVECFEFLQEGRCLITGSGDSTIKIWDMRGERVVCIETVNAHKTAILVLSFCPSNSLLASSGRDSVIKLWNITKLLKYFGNQEGDKKNDKSGVTVVQDRIIEGHRGDIVTLSWQQDGIYLWSGARDNQAIKWNINTRMEEETIKRHKGDVKKVVLVKGGAVILTAAADGYIKSWEIQIKQNTDEENVEEESNINGFEDQIENEELKKLLSNTKDVKKLLRKEDINNSTILNKCKAHEEGIFTMEPCPVAPLIVTASRHNSVRIWGIGNGFKMNLIHEFVGHHGSINDIEIAEEGEGGNERNSIFTCSLDYTIHQYDVLTMSRMLKIDLGCSVNTISVSPEKNVLFAGGTNYNIHAFALNETSVESENTNLCMRREVARFIGHGGRIIFCAVSPNGNMMASASSDFKLITWKLKNKWRPTICNRGQLDKHKGIDFYLEQPSKFQITQDQYLVPEIVKPKKKYEAHEGIVQQVVFDRSGNYMISTGNDHKMIIWKVKEKSGTIAILAEYPDAHDGAISGACWCTDTVNAKQFATCSWDRTVKIWNFDTRSKKITAIKTLKYHLDKVNDIDVSADQSFLFSCSSDFTVRCYELTKPYNCVAVYSVLREGPLNCIRVGTDSFVTGSENGLIRIWPSYIEQYYDMFKDEIGEFEKKKLALRQLEEDHQKKNN